MCYTYSTPLQENIQSYILKNICQSKDQEPNPPLNQNSKSSLFQHQHIGLISLVILTTFKTYSFVKAVKIMLLYFGLNLVNSAQHNWGYERIHLFQVNGFLKIDLADIDGNNVVSLGLRQTICSISDLCHKTSLNISQF